MRRPGFPPSIRLAGKAVAGPLVESSFPWEEHRDSTTRVTTIRFSRGSTGGRFYGPHDDRKPFSSARRVGSSPGQAGNAGGAVQGTGQGILRGDAGFLPQGQNR